MTNYELVITNDKVRPAGGRKAPIRNSSFVVRAFAKRRRGMTLIEIMVVVVILGVTMAVAFPQMAGMNRKNKLRAAAREIVALSKAARAEAVFGERTTELILDLQKHEFWIDLRRPEEEKKKGTRTSGKGMEKKNLKSRLEEKRSLPTPTIFFQDAAAQEQNIIKDKLIAIDFYPDGSASPTLFDLRNDKGQAVTIEILKASGTAEITPGTVQDKQQSIEEAAYNVPMPPTGGAGAI